MSGKLMIAMGLFVIANVFAWFQSNSQFVWKWWYDHPVLTVFIYAIPTSITFFFGWRYAVEATGELWGARMVGFGIGTIMFSLMTYFMMGEGLSYKTLTCVLLSICIILIQILWK
jgi:hypothetical protein